MESKESDLRADRVCRAALLKITASHRETFVQNRFREETISRPNRYLTGIGAVSTQKLTMPLEGNLKRFFADPDYWKGEVFAYVGRNQNLKDLTDARWINSNSRLRTTR